ncbi:MAG TPA: guanylate kinase [Acidimicrobiales bacterium]|nr:guanylate kinase [Acidimicrobiales bacterium]
MSQPVILVISGPGGVGKGTVVSRLVELDDRLWVSRSWTTRPARPGEPPDAYVFVDRKSFEARIAAGGFLEWTEFAGNGCLYGTPSLEPPPGCDVVLEIELDGAQQVKAAHPEAVVVLVVAPSRQAQEDRLRGRGDDEVSVAARVAVGVEEERTGRAFADAVVVNDDVERAAREVEGILVAARLAAGR